MFARQTPEQVAIAPDGIELPGRGAPCADSGELPLPPAEIRLRGAAQPRERDGRGGRRAAPTGVPPEAVAEALRTFAGVPHRLEEVGTVDGVLYVNDSKATNVSSAARGIESFFGGRPRRSSAAASRAAASRGCASRSPRAAAPAT